METLTPQELNTLYGNFTSYRDNICNGMAKISVPEFYKRFGLGAYYD